MNQKQYWEEGTPWQIQSGKEVSILVKQGYKSAIDHFKLEDANGNDVTDQILHLPKVYLVFSYKPEKMSEIDKNTIDHIEELTLNNNKVYGVSTKANVFPSIPNLTMDGTCLLYTSRCV